MSASPTADPIPPTTEAEVRTRLAELAAAHQTELNALERRRGATLLGLLATLAALVGLTVAALRPGCSGWPLLAALLVLAWLIRGSLALQAKVTREQRRMSFYDTAAHRADGSATQSGRTGTEAAQTLREAGHLYDRDLSLLGENSLFGLLAIVRTGPGERGLADYLLQPATHAETLARQAAVRELLPRVGLRERIALLGVSRFHRIPASFFDDWLDDPAPPFHPAWRYVLGATAVLAVALLLTGLTHVRPWATVLPRLLACLAVQGAISLFLRARVKPVLEAGARLQDHVKLFSEGLAVLQAESFTAAKLTGLQQLSRQPAGAVKLLARLESQLAIIEQRPKEYFLLFSLLLAAGTQAAIAVAGWKRRHATAMRGWLTAWAEFEALNALAAYAWEHPEDAWPELAPEAEGPVYEGVAMGHPLLAAAVRNDVRFDAAEPFYLVSGSNMAGKSTLLRAIGINAVLAYAGAPVRARSLRLSPLVLGASLALTDSLAEGKSRFLAEVERLAAIVSLSRLRPTLFLVDEIFSGTNSADRRLAAGAVLNSLLANGAMGALSTHDLALAELATQANGGRNVHMASADEDDPLAFDYLLKPGVNPSSNALAIVRMLGLEVSGE